MGNKELLEIKQQIDEYNRQIEGLLSPNQFTLNNMIVELSKEIDKLQSKCTHEFEEGFCIWCYKQEN